MWISTADTATGLKDSARFYISQGGNCSNSHVTADGKTDCNSHVRQGRLPHQRGDDRKICHYCALRELCWSCTDKAERPCRQGRNQIHCRQGRGGAYPAESDQPYGRGDRFPALREQQGRTVPRLAHPQKREWILVGLAEGTVGYSTVSGHMESLRAPGVEDTYYEDGKVAFFAKGTIKGEWLLTMAYDSGKTGAACGPGSSLFQTINPNSYYTLYSDNSQQQYDAASARKLLLYP